MAPCLSTAGQRISAAGIAAIAAAVVLFTGCGNDAGDESLVTTLPPDEVIRVSLSEWAVVAEAETAGRGIIQFAVDNRGVEVHELVLLRDGRELGEVEGLAPGRLETIRFELEPGKYELACVIKETEPSGEVEDHYKRGMHTAFEVR